MSIRWSARFLWLVVCLSLAAVSAGAEQQSAGAGAQPAAEPLAAKPAHRVIACYFHRTVRCPTCKKISAYIEESINAGFAKELKDGLVSVQMVDFQNPKNQKVTAHYKITGPTLVILDVRDEKMKAWKPAPKVWSLVGRKAEFFKYVQNEVRAYLEEKEVAAREASAHD